MSANLDKKLKLNELTDDMRTECLKKLGAIKTILEYRAPTRDAMKETD
jgi:hypothetical protein